MVLSFQEGAKEIDWEKETGGVVPLFSFPLQSLCLPRLLSAVWGPHRFPLLCVPFPGCSRVSALSRGTGRCGVVHCPVGVYIWRGRLVHGSYPIASVGVILISELMAFHVTMFSWCVYMYSVYVCTVVHSLLF
jgi:hypothetical protein